MNDLQKICDFLAEIGIVVRQETISEDTLLPGILLDRGELIVDQQKLKYVGDLLHEAGHVAVVASEDRTGLSGRLSRTKEEAKGEEMMAIAWSWAAAKHLDIAPEVVFHDAFKAGGANLRENFGSGHYFGVPLLQWRGLTWESHQAQQRGVAGYPAMIKWMRD